MRTTMMVIVEAKLQDQSAGLTRLESLVTRRGSVPSRIISYYAGTVADLVYACRACASQRARGFSERRLTPYFLDYL